MSSMMAPASAWRASASPGCVLPVPVVPGANCVDAVGAVVGVVEASNVGAALEADGVVYLGP